MTDTLSIGGDPPFVTTLYIDALGYCAMAENDEAYESGRRTAVKLPDEFLAMIESIFPPYGGGKVVYAEDCEIWFQKAGDRAPLISRIRVKREDEGLELTWYIPE